jgi:hypothetical protein
VDQITIGLIVGAPSKNPTATEAGIPWVNNRRATGTFPHSHTGRRQPSTAPATAPPKGCRGKIFSNCSGSTHSNRMLENSTPNTKKGIASTNKLKNKVNPCCSAAIGLTRQWNGTKRYQLFGLYNTPTPWKIM